MPTASTSGAAAPISEDDVRASLTRVLGDEEGTEVWQATCRDAQIPRPGPALDLEQITTLAELLSQRSDLGSVVGNSLSVKLRTRKHR